MSRFAGLIILWCCPALLSCADPTAPAAVVTAAPVINSGDTAWVLTSAALVLFMTIPGLGLFYAGLVRTKNALAVMMQCFTCTAVMTLLWVLVGYSLAFDQTHMSTTGLNLQSFVGWFGKAGLLGLTADSVHPLMPTVPEAAFCIFQLSFAIITPALLVGAFAERIRFSAMLLITSAWMLLVYCPLAHMAWGGPGALFFDWGLLDTAGGTAIEANSGIAALVLALMVGRRQGFPQTPMIPHNMLLCATGAGMLWVGWFGFNAGGVGAANGTTAMTVLATQLAAAAAAVTWSLIEWFKNGKPSALGAITGAVGGLVAITPAAMFVGPLGAIVVGMAAGFACWFAVVKLKSIFKYDDSLDVFGVHGVGGIVGTILTGVLAAKALGGSKDIEPLAQTLIQLKALAVTAVWSIAVTWLIVKLTDRLVGLRVTASEERTGLDLASHGETAYQYEERL